MPRKRVKVVIDTNIWISFLLTKTVSKLDEVFSSGDFSLLFSQELIEEFIEVAQRPKFRKYFTTNDLEDLVFQIQLRSEFIKVTSIVDMCRDPKDNFLLALAKDGKANYLITGDKDLLALGKIGRTNILTLGQFNLEKSTTR